MAGTDLSEEYWVIYKFSDQHAPELYPEGSSFLKYKELYQMREELATLHPKAIVLAPEWIVGQLESICGHLHAFVKNGGHLIVHRGNPGRVGTNRQYYNWLPEDFECLNCLAGNTWTFDAARLPAGFDSESPIYCDWIRPNKIISDAMPHFAAKYGEGLFIFEGRDPNRELYSQMVEDYPLNNVQDFATTPSWRWRRIPQLYRDEEINREADIYPILGVEVLQDHLGLLLSTTFSNQWLTGSEPGYVDLFTVYPALTIWEIDSVGRGGTAGESTAIDIGHACKTPVYGHRAEKQYRALQDIVSQCQANDAKLFEVEAGAMIHMVEDNLIMNEVLTTHLNNYMESHDRFDLEEFEAYIYENMRPLDDIPGVSLVGISYGFTEGEKESAREISKREMYSLWSYRDIYEFLVRTEDMTMEDRRDELLRILNLRDGPVYEEVGRLGRITPPPA